MTRIAVASDFNKFPGGRYPRHGDGNGEDFREKLLLPPLRRGESVIVVFDDTAGYPASFLEEAFGGLLRAGITLEEIHKNLTIETQDEESTVYKEEAWQYIEEAAARSTAA